MKIRTMLLAAAAVMAGSAAQAQTLSFSPIANGFVTSDLGSTNAADTATLTGPGSATLNNNGAGGTISANTTITSSSVFFRSGAAVSGPNSYASVTTGVDMSILNSDDGAIALENFTSTIIPAGMGFFMQNRDPGAVNVFLDGGPTTSGATFDSLFGAVGNDLVFAGASFDFQVRSDQSDVTFINLYGETGLKFVSGELTQTFTVGFEDALGQLVEYQSFNHPVHSNAFDLSTTLLWDWSATEILIPLSSIGNLGAYSTQVIQYRATVTAFTRAPCLGEGGTDCLVAFSAFGDPIGRGGADEEFAISGQNDPPEDQLSRGHPFHTRGFNGLGFREVEFSKSQLNSAAAVPEPATWALMIGGFGLAGAALRRRRRAATA